MLQKAGIVVTLVENGAEAVSAFSAHRFDAVLTDINMRVMDGREAASRIQSIMSEDGLGARRIPIVALTASVSTEEERRCHACGIVRVFSKPIRSSTVSDIVNLIKAYHAERGVSKDLTS
jgi:CheY-like chemotaxis protein